MNASVNKELLTILLGAGAMLDATDNELSCEKITNKVIAQRQRVFVNSNEKIIYENPLENSLQAWYYDYTKKAPAPKWMLPRRLNVLTDTAYPVCRQDRHFYFRFFFLLLRKASNAITRLPKAHNNVSMPMKIEMISKAVIHATSLPMYSGKPGIWCWEATTLSWVLSVKILYHVSN